LSRYLTVPVPTGLMIAIQYFVPMVTGMTGTVALFHAPFMGEAIVACASNVPGALDALFVYKPTTTFVAVFVLSRYTKSVSILPDVPAVY
jgi:hypothetical protein